jgi:uncharacterized protein YkwD
VIGSKLNRVERAMSTFARRLWTRTRSASEPARMETKRRTILSRAAVGALLVLLWSCGGTQVRGTLGPGVSGVVRAPSPTVPTYATSADPGEVAIGGEVAQSVRRGVERAGQEHSMPLEGDPRLAQLASWLAERLEPGGEPPPNEVVEFFARHLGLVEPVPHLMILGQPVSDMEEGVASSVGQFMTRQTYNRYGLAVVERGGLNVAVVVLSWRWVELEPIPRRIDANAPLGVRGRLVGDHRNPALVVARPDGQLTRLPAGSGPDFDVRVPTTSGAGTYQVELVGRGPHGDTVIANFPVYVGTNIPEEVRVGETTGSGSQDVESVRRELLDLLNATRREAHLSEVAEHAPLREVAVAHSRDMAEHDFVGHTSPRSGTAADRVAAAHLPTGLVLENIGRGYSAQEIHHGLLESPGHRANLINPNVSHVGIGVVTQADGDRPAFLVTEVFVRMAERVDLSNAAQRLLELMNRARSARGAPALELVPALSNAAGEAATRYFAEPNLTQQEAVDDASASLRRFAIAYRRLGGVMAVVNDIDEAGSLEPTLDREVRYVGVGAAQGTRPDSGPNAIAVVIVLAWPR